MSVSIVYAILVTSLATFLSRFLGVITSEGIKETSKLFKWFNCLAYATLAALIARTIIFPAGILIDASYVSRFIVIVLSLFVFFLSKKNFVYPTIFSAIFMAILNNFI
jgi:branched-subunit amino acid transport protein